MRYARINHASTRSKYLPIRVIKLARLQRNMKGREGFHSQQIEEHSRSRRVMCPIMELLDLPGWVIKHVVPFYILSESCRVQCTDRFRQVTIDCRVRKVQRLVLIVIQNPLIAIN